MKKMSDAKETSETNNTNDISKAEYDVLDALWEGYPATSKEIVERLNKKKNWHDKTVKTLLGRLVKKQVVQFDKNKRQYLYSPLIARDEYTQKETNNFVSKLFKGKIAPMVAGFANHNALSKQDIDELKELIEKWEQKDD